MDPSAWSSTSTATARLGPPAWRCVLSGTVVGAGGQPPRRRQHAGRARAVLLPALGARPQRRQREPAPRQPCRLPVPPAPQGAVKGEGGLDDATGTNKFGGGASMKQTSAAVDLTKVKEKDDEEKVGAATVGWWSV